jgi:hypothetical protein
MSSDGLQNAVSRFHGSQGRDSVDHRSLLVEDAVHETRQLGGQSVGLGDFRPIDAQIVAKDVAL